MNRLDIIKTLIEKFGYKSYLEIGVYLGSVLKNVNIEKAGVDPVYDCNYKMTSDKFFNQLSDSKKYDLIFIDGLHEYEQVSRDISNSLKHLSQGGIIAMHDCNPPTKWHQRELSEFDGSGKFNGTVWKAFVECRVNREGLTMFVVDCDWGVGIIKRESEMKFPNIVYRQGEDIMSYDWFEKNRRMALNLIDEKHFIKWVSSEVSQ